MIPLVVVGIRLDLDFGFFQFADVLEDLLQRRPVRCAIVESPGNPGDFF